MSDQHSQQAGQPTQGKATTTSQWAIVRWWRRFSDRHTTLAQFIVFFILSNGVTVLQLSLIHI